MSFDVFSALKEQNVCNVFADISFIFLYSIKYEMIDWDNSIPEY